ncbi:type VI secretion system-associated FHA domain protein TagH [Roseibium sp.]|uniref:type VI secretion system-associated FHA domain protein TagH n=1 Tax=Roseibium sp. TaxID=1936156 RepID=UPI003BAF89F7
MRITLQIENVDHLDTGGQLSYSCSDRGFDIGRHEHLDWSLPDPQRVISGKHCEIRFEGGQYVLYDFSTNGTFLNGSQTRMDKAHVLRTGDRLMIGDYIIKVSLEASAGAASHPQWSAPQPEPVAAAPAWPSTADPAPQSPYPSEPGGGPWASPVAGMEGRHAPPSAAPGIGTPADDVWSQQGHGWGSADPALYDPQAQPMEREQVRPAQADPLDHLAQQPHLYPEPASPAGQEPVPPPPEPPVSAPAPSFPSAEISADGAPPEPLFKLPEMEDASAQPEPVGSPVAAVAEPEAAVSPFPEAGGWAEPAPAQVAEPPQAPQPPAAAEPAPKAPEASAPVDPKTGGDVLAEAPVPPVAAPATPSPETAAPEAPAQEVAALPSDVDILKAFAEGAGISPDVLKGRDPEEFARELGAVLSGVTGDLMGLLQARSQVKAMTRNVNRTLIMRSGNNALKFSPTPAMALQTMLSQGAEETGYLPISKAMSAAFKDIQKHHVWTYAAMQKAAARFEETLSPKAIEDEGQVAKSTFGNQKAKLWEKLDERWTSLTKAYDDGLVGVFTQYFTESYEDMSSDDLDEMPGR